MIDLGLLGTWGLNRGLDLLSDWLLTPSLSKSLRDTVSAWIAQLPSEFGSLHAETLLRHTERDGEATQVFAKAMREQRLPESAEILAFLMESWNGVRESVSERAPFFDLSPEVAEAHLGTLAERLHRALAQHDEFWKPAVLSLLAKNQSRSYRQDIDLATAALRTADFPHAAGVLAFYRSYYWSHLDDVSRYALLKGHGSACRLLGHLASAATALLEAAQLAVDPVEARELEVKALVLQERDADAVERAWEYVKDAPRSTSLWSTIIALSTDAVLEDVLGQAPSVILNHSDVLLALAVGYEARGDHEAALKYANRARSAGCKSLSLFCLLVRLRLLPVRPRHVPLRVRSEHQVVLHEVLELCEAGLSLAIGAPIEAQQVLALMLDKADALLLLGHREQAKETALNAARRFPAEAAAQRAYGKWLAETGNLPAAIRAYRDALALCAAPWPQLDLELAGLLAISEDPDDRAEALGLLFDLVASADVGNLRLDALRLLVDLAEKMQRVVEAAEFVASLQRLRPLVQTIYLAWLRAKNGETEPALLAATAAQADPSVQSLDPEDLLRLADVYVGLDQFCEAESILDLIDPQELLQSDLHFAIRCYARAGALKTLDLCKLYQATYGHDTAVLHAELDILQELDFQRAAQRMETHLAEYPKDRWIWLRLAALGIRAGRADWISPHVERYPDPESNPSCNIRIVTTALQTVGAEESALRYAYRHLRTHPTSADARDAFLRAVFAGYREPEIPEFQEVQLGTAVTLRSDSGQEQSVILEEEDVATYSAEECEPDSALAQKLIGRRVGESLVSGAAFEPSWSIVRIEHKYRVWIRRLMTAAHFPTTPGAFRSLSIPTDSQGVRKLARHLASTRQESTAGVLGRYQSTPALPIHAVAHWLRMDVFDLAFGLLTGDRGFLKADPGLPMVELGEDSNARGFVLDETAIAAIFYAGLAEYLTGGAVELAVPQETVAAIRRLLTEPRFHRPHVFVRQEGLRLVAFEFGPDDLASARQQMERVLQWLQQSCAELTPLSLASTSNRMADLRDILGPAAVEAGHAAIASDRVLLSDDWAQRGIVRARGGTTLTTAQLVEVLAGRGALSGERAALVKARLLEGGYLGVHVSTRFLETVCAMSSWDPDGDPLRRVFRFLWNRDIPAQWRVEVSATLVCAAMDGETSAIRRNAVVDEVLRAGRVLGMASTFFDEMSEETWRRLGSAHRRAFRELLGTHEARYACSRHADQV